MVTQKVGEGVLHPDVTKQLFSHRGGRSFLITHFTAKYFPDRVIYLNFYFPVNFTPFQDMFDFHTGTSMTITPDGIRNQEMSLTADLESTRNRHKFGLSIHILYLLFGSLIFFLIFLQI